MRDKKQYKKTIGKVIHGLTAEERFKEIHGMTIEEWNAKLEEKLRAKSGMTSDEWYINRIKSLSPIDFIKERNDIVTPNDVKLVKDLQDLGLNDGVINVLLDYVAIVSKIGLVHPLVREMGKDWFDKGILTIEKAIVFVREEQKKYKESLEK